MARTARTPFCLQPAGAHHTRRSDHKRDAYSLGVDLGLLVQRVQRRRQALAVGARLREQVEEMLGRVKRARAGIWEG